MLLLLLLVVLLSEASIWCCGAFGLGWVEDTFDPIGDMKTCVDCGANESGTCRESEGMKVEVGKLVIRYEIRLSTKTSQRGIAQSSPYLSKMFMMMRMMRMEYECYVKEKDRN